MSNVVPFPAQPGLESPPGHVRPGSERPDSERPVSERPEPLWRESVGEVLRAERLQRAERIIDVAERAGVAPQYLSEIERGRKDASSEVLAAVAGALDLTVQRIAAEVASRSAVPTGPVCLAA